jgi:hypothetical protein
LCTFWKRLQPEGIDHGGASARRGTFYAFNFKIEVVLTLELAGGQSVAGDREAVCRKFGALYKAFTKRA